MSMKKEEYKNKWKKSTKKNEKENKIYKNITRIKYFVKTIAKKSKGCIMEVYKTQRENFAVSRFCQEEIAGPSDHKIPESIL